MSDNRTSEFLNFARSLPGSDRSAGPSASVAAAGQATGPAGAVVAADATKASPAYAELRSFHATAAEISRDIAATSRLLGQLTQLVRHRSVFDDDAARVNDLVVRIKGGIENLNARLDAASHTIQRQKRQLNSQAGQEAANLVEGLKTEFAAAASGFKRVLQQRTDNLKESEDFQRSVYGKLGDDSIPNITLAPPPVYASAPTAGNHDGSGAGSHLHGSSLLSTQSAFPTLDLTSSLMTTGEATGPVLPRPHGIQVSESFGAAGSLRHRNVGSESSTYYPYGRANTVPLTPLDIQRMEEESGMMQMQLIPDQDYLRERADAMSTVESNIVELGTIFNKLAVMVSEHQELVQRVEDNVEEANATINLSLGVLTDTLASLRTNRMLALKVFSVLVTFIIMFIIFFA